MDEFLDIENMSEYLNKILNRMATGKKLRKSPKCRTKKQRGVI